jgi:hypothetical protein
VLLGLAFDYGEARSWVHNLVLSDAGPHTYLAGVAGRVAVTHELSRRLELFGQIEGAVHHAHAKDTPFGNEYNWLASSIAAGVGVRVAALAGRD